MIITPKHTVGIVGGHGKTGSQFATLFRSQGFPVRVTGSRTQDRNRRLVSECNIVLFALPLSSAASIIRDLASSATRKDQLLLDVSSLKTDETKAMLSSQGEVIGMHPLFGPGTDPAGERVILCPARAKRETLQSLRATLGAMGLRTSVMTPGAHDKLMATVQVIPHLKSFLMADVLRLLQTDLSSALKTCTPTYRLEFNVIGRFLDDHPDLYMPIIFRNPETTRILRLIRTITDEYLAIADTRNLPLAEARYRLCKQRFVRHLRKARRESEACIRTLLSST